MLRTLWGTSPADRSVRRSWILSYAVVMVLPLLVSLFVALGTHRVLQDQIQDSSSLVADLLGKEVEGRLAYVLRLANDVATHPLTGLVLEGYPSDERTFRTQLVTLADALATHGSYNRFDDFFFLSLTQRKGVVLPRTYYSFDEFYQFHFEGTEASATGLQTLLARRLDNQARSLRFIDSLGRNRSVIAFLKSLPAQSSEPMGTVGVFLDSAALVESLHSAVEAKGWEIRIIDGDQHLLLSSLSADQVGSEVVLGQPWSRVNVGNSAYIATSKPVGLLGWTVELLTPEVQVWERLWWVQVGTLAGLVTSLVLGIGLTGYWMRRNYRPVRRLLAELARRTGAEGSPTKNEFLRIETALVTAFEERYQALERFEKHKALLQENLVARMLAGAPDPGQGWEASLTALEMAGEGEFLVVLTEGDGNLPREEFQTLCLDHLTRLVAGRGTVWPAASLDDLIFVVQGAPGAGSMLASDLHRTDLPFIPLLSDVVVGWEALPQALVQVRVVRDHRYSLAGAGVLSYGELPSDQSGSPYPLTPALEDKLLHALRAGDQGAALEVLGEVTAPPSRGLAPQEARILVNDLGSCFLKALPQGTLGTEQRHDLLSALEAVANRKTVEESFGALRDLVLQVCHRVRDLQSQHHDKLRNEHSQKLTEKVRQYLQARFQDSQLTLTVIADDLGYSATYLSRFFKEAQEEGLMETLARIRLDHARKLLRRSDSPLAFVALECGFTDVNTFIRTFKKYYGITPGRFRETMG